MKNLSFAFLLLPLLAFALPFSSVSAADEKTAPTTLASGSWTKKKHEIKGTWKIIEDGGKKYIKLYGLSTKKAPDLKIYLSPKTVSAVDSKNATTGSTFVAKLASHKGNQTYELPAGVDIKKFKSVLIHCKKYTKLWGAASL